jgi:tetratricopeptide (TPR) repeat protein
MLKGAAIALVALLTGAPASAREKAPWIGTSFEGLPCTGSGTANFGPFDYRTDKNRLPIVENYHFTPEMEQLRFRRLQDSMGNVRYTITKFPNHHRALYTAVRFSLMDAETKLKRKHPAECFLQRAIAFRRNDAVPYQLFGLYLHRLDQTEKAMEYYRKAEELSPQDPMLQYNIALVLLDQNKPEEAAKYAGMAYGAGVTLPGLKKRLQAAGYEVPENESSPEGE